MPNLTVELIDYRADDLPVAVLAAIEFLAERNRWQKAMRAHIPAKGGWCALHREQWPCLLWRLAESARGLADSKTSAQRSGARA